MNLKEVKNSCLILRKTIELMDINEFPMYTQFKHASFPEGTCCDSSLILGRYLLEKHNMLCTYVSGSYFDNEFQEHTHAWLEYQEWKIDITADQFDRIKEPVLVVYNHEIYDFFEDKEYVKISDYIDNYPHQLEKLYSIITLKIK